MALPVTPHKDQLVQWDGTQWMPTEACPSTLKPAVGAALGLFIGSMVAAGITSLATSKGETFPAPGAIGFT